MNQTGTRMVKIKGRLRRITNDGLENFSEHTYKVSVFLCRARIPSSSRRQRPSRIPLTVENKSDKTTMEIKWSCEHLKNARNVRQGFLACFGPVNSYTFSFFR